MKKIHYKYIMGILCGIICALAAGILTKLEYSPLLTFLSAFSTLISILLSVFAIIYTFKSGMESQSLNERTNENIINIRAYLDAMSTYIKANSMLTDVDKVIEQAEKSPDYEQSETSQEFVKDLKGLKVSLKGITSEFNKSMTEDQ